MEQNSEELKMLVEKAQNGDRDAFKEIFDRLSDRFFAYTFSRTSNRDDALDISQETFIELWNSLKRFKYRSDQSFHGFLFKIIKRKLYQYYKKKQKIVSLDVLDEKQLVNANISVCIDREFLKLLDNDGDIIFKWQGEERGKMKAKCLWDKIIQNAWESGDPGLMNLGLMQEQNNLIGITEIISTNPCGEIPLSKFGSCCLGSINLSTHVVNGEIDWDLLEETVAIAVRFLDNVLDQNRYPLQQISDISSKHRRIGLGIMGLHDMLLKMRFKYDTDGARDIADKIMNFIKKRAYDTSIMLAIEKGPFQLFDPDKFLKSGFVKKSLSTSLKRRIKDHGIRNCALLTIPPTGTTAIVAECSSGIEPLFQLVYRRNFNKHTKNQANKREAANEIIIHPLVKQFLESEKSVSHFQTASDILPRDHLAMQEVCQSHIDQSISKTINLPHNYPVEELSHVIRQFVDTLKGITIYRDGSKGESPLVPLSIEEAKKHLRDITISVSSSEECATNSCNS